MAGLRNLGRRVRRGRGQVRWLVFVAGHAGSSLPCLLGRRLGGHEEPLLEREGASTRMSGRWGVRAVPGGMRGSQ